MAVAVAVVAAVEVVNSGGGGGSCGECLSSVGQHSSHPQLCPHTHVHANGCAALANGCIHPPPRAPIGLAE